MTKPDPNVEREEVADSRSHGSSLDLSQPAAVKPSELPAGAYLHDYSVVSWSPMLLSESPSRTYRVGYVATPHGVVGIYGQSGDRPYTALSMVLDGRAYDASWQRAFTDRYLKTLAKRFAAKTATKPLIADGVNPAHGRSQTEDEQP